MGHISKKNIIVVGLGEILWDVLPDGKQLGGAPANFAYFVNTFGFQGIPVSRVGDDAAGREILTQLSQKGINTDYIAMDQNHPTGTVTIALDDKGKPDYIIHEHVAWDYLEMTDKLFQLASSADVVCYGVLSGRFPESAKTIERFLNATGESCLKVFDINIRKEYYAAERIHKLLQFANVFKLNDEELPLMADLFKINGSETDILRYLSNTYHLDLIILTKGEHGGRLFTPIEDSIFKGEKISRIVDTVGAGDSFTATVIAGLLAQKSLSAISTHANRVAAYVCTQKGAMPALPPELIL